MPAKAIASQVSFVPVPETGYYSKLVNDYVNENQDLKSFYAFELNDAGLKKAIDARKSFPVDREVLHEVISEQYAGIELSPAVKANLDLLRAENTFTVCSAHQPNLMTGYLYFIYKIVHSVKLTAHLKTLDATANFVPVFYIGSEDNDFEELGHFRFSGKVFEWNTTQTGAVGMMLVDEPLEHLIKELLSLLGPSGVSEKYLRNTILAAYKKRNSIAMATRILINDLLGFLGVLVLDANDARLKRKFVSVIKEEVLRPKAFELVKQDSERLNETYKAQAFFRPINFFYLKEGLRERIELINNEYLVLNTELKFSPAEMEAEIEAHPERFSPNVILRGLYQESILPDIAFIGGGSEVAYWMQLKGIFKHYQVYYPAVILRQSAVVLDQKTTETQAKADLDDHKMFRKTAELIEELVSTEKEEQWSLATYFDQLQQWKEALTQKYVPLDKNLKGSISAVVAKVQAQLDILDKKINRAIKKGLEIQVERIYSFKEHAFPNDSLQERYETFLPFYLNYGQKFFEDLYQHTDPFGKQFLVLKYKSDD